MSHTIKDAKNNKRDKLDRRNRAAVRKAKHGFLYSDDKKKPDRFIDYRKD